MSKPRALKMRFVAIVPFEGSQVGIGPVNSMKEAEAYANLHNGFVIPILRVDRVGSVEQREDFKHPF
ncbi:hypothetical protein BAJUN_01150 [Bajunvirus bajun]|uniref:Uncharacterized protein n=1 Tax=Brevundimonas phage vB_BgoS-Bajun TaxID=2948594 RepID=A0A9E7N629_9CAUD|nr:hypothetical protein BAJUN_01150 [Brevundimonas phage vB_BgoS-Bajun]